MAPIKDDGIDRSRPYYMGPDGRLRMRLWLRAAPGAEETDRCDPSDGDGDSDSDSDGDQSGMTGLSKLVGVVRLTNFFYFFQPLLRPALLEALTTHSRLTNLTSR